MAQVVRRRVWKPRLLAFGGSSRGVGVYFRISKIASNSQNKRKLSPEIRKDRVRDRK